MKPLIPKKNIYTPSFGNKLITLLCAYACDVNQLLQNGYHNHIQFAYWQLQTSVLANFNRQQRLNSIEHLLNKLVTGK